MFPLPHPGPGTRRVSGRPPFLLAAVIAVAVPGFLVTGCTGQPGASASSHEAPAQTAARTTARASAHATPRPAATRRSSALALSLLIQAAQAAVMTSYQGEEIVSRWYAGGGTFLVSDIWHVSGGQSVTRTLAAGTSASNQPYVSADTDSQSPEGVLGVTATLVQLLETHYIVSYAGRGSADNRAAQVVEAWRGDGSIAARFWLDEATKLPLEREVFDTDARMIGQDAFINVQFTRPVALPVQTRAGPWTVPLARAQLLALRSRGWLVPAALPGGLSLFTGAQTTTSTGTAVDLGYSDGLYVVSVFEQRGNLAAKLAGWQKTTVNGRVVYAAEPDQRSFTWSAHDMVYTVMADAPDQTVDAVVCALPHQQPPGFWKRMSRGLARLASWADPFH